MKAEAGENVAIRQVGCVDLGYPSSPRSRDGGAIGVSNAPTDALSLTFSIILSIAMILTVAASTVAAELATSSATHSPTMSNSRATNAASIRSQIAMMNRGDWAGALQFYTSDSKNFGRHASRALMAKVFEDLYATFPDYNIKILDVVAKDDWVIVRGTSSGTHKGMGRLPLNGGLLVGVPPTNKHFQADVIHWFKMNAGKIVDHYDVRDDLAMMQQLGLIPTPKPFDWSKSAAEADRR